MNKAVLEVLVERWEEDGVVPKTQNASDVEGNLIREGERVAKRQCADTLRMLMEVLGE